MVRVVLNLAVKTGGASGKYADIIIMVIRGLRSVIRFRKSPTNSSLRFGSMRRSGHQAAAVIR